MNGLQKRIFSIALHAIKTSDLLIFTINLHDNLNTLILEDQ